VVIQSEPDPAPSAPAPARQAAPSPGEAPGAGRPQVASRGVDGRAQAYISKKAEKVVAPEAPAAEPASDAAATKVDPKRPEVADYRGQAALATLKGVSDQLTDFQARLREEEAEADREPPAEPPRPEVRAYWDTLERELPGRPGSAFRENF
jgi:hypothetical protein